MRHTITALIAAAVLSSSALLSTASAQTSGNTAVYFSNTSDLYGAVDFYVDGVKTGPSVFPSSPETFPTQVPSGTHQIIVTRAGVPLGQQDLLTQTVSIPQGGTYTVNIAQETNDADVAIGYSLSVGEGDNENLDNE